MKIEINRRRPYSAFTLIELLVVIAIIAILATIAVPAGGKVMERARKLQAKAAMKGLEIAINGYRTEYNRMPLASSAGSDYVEYKTDTDGKMLLDTLMGKDDTNNPRRIKFYEPPTAKNRSNGYDPDDGSLLDPWGQPYTVIIDYSGEGLIPNPYTGDGEPENLSASVVIYSHGPDKAFENASGDNGGKVDDVKSWD